LKIYDSPNLYTLDCKKSRSNSLSRFWGHRKLPELKLCQWLKLPIKNLDKPCQLFNVDGTENKAGMLKHYTDIEVQTGTSRTQLCFFLSDLGEHKAILGYLWFAAVQPKIDWKQGWIDSSQLPIILRAPNAKKHDSYPV